jgi:hypothetical protein
MLAKTPASPYAAVFIDFENVYYFLKNHFHDPPDLHDYVLDIVRKLREELSKKGLDCLVINAYADFERLATAPQGAFYLMGVSTRNVLGTDHKNAADMQLCIDALEVMYTRPDIGTFVLVAGDRDYIPVLQHLRRQARQVLVVGFREAVSGDLIQNLGSQHFLDARDLLPEERVAQLEKRRADRQRMAEESRRLREQGLAGVQSAAARAVVAQVPAEGPTPPDSEVAPKAANVSPVPAAGAPRPVVPIPRPVPEEVPTFAPVRRLARDLERRTLECSSVSFRSWSSSSSAGCPSCGWALSCAASPTSCRSCPTTSGATCSTSCATRAPSASKKEKASRILSQ